MNETEFNMIKDMQENSEEAFTWLFDRYQKKLFRTAYLISGNYADSEDIVQETMIKCFRSCRELKELERFESWLYQILTRTAWRTCRKKKAECPVEEIWDEAEQSDAPLPLDEAIRRETSNKLYSAVCRLEIKQRTVVILYYYNEMSTREIAAATKSMEGTVKSRLFAARKNLKRIWQTEEGEREGLYEGQTI